MKIKTIIITDPLGEETTEEIINQISEDTKISPEYFNVILHATAVTEEVESKSVKADLIVIDYGGMTIGASDTCVAQVRWVCEWAREHPGKLVVLYTMFTAELYVDELEEQFGDCDNIIARYCDPYSNEREKLSSWLSAMGGLTLPAPGGGEAMTSYRIFIDRFDSVSDLRGRKRTYENIKAAVLKAGRFSCFDVENEKDGRMFTRLCHDDPEIETFDMGYPWTGVRLREAKR